jgi:hypothetical protein
MDPTTQETKTPHFAKKKLFFFPFYAIIMGYLVFLSISSSFFHFQYGVIAI